MRSCFKRITPACTRVPVTSSAEHPVANSATLRPRNKRPSPLSCSRNRVAMGGVVVSELRLSKTNTSLSASSSWWSPCIRRTPSPNT